MGCVEYCILRQEMYCLSTSKYFTMDLAYLYEERNWELGKHILVFICYIPSVCVLENVT